MNKISVEVVYASHKQQKIIAIEVNLDTTIESAILQSGILNYFPEIDLKINKVGIFSKLRKLSEVVSDGDRIEIYRPLLIDPKEARRARVKRK